MSIKDAENKLFNKWRGSRAGFVSDGVISETEYMKSTPKITFILKEVNDKGGGDWDLREFVSEGGRPQTWDNITRWVHGIRNITSVPKWNRFKDVTDDFRKDTLKSICAMNLKKSPGTHTAVHADLHKVAKEDKDYIKDQYALYDPSITICCGTGDLFKSIVNPEIAGWKVTTRGVYWYERGTGKFVVDFAHPEARVKSSLLVYGLLDAIREIYTEVGADVTHTPPCELGAGNPTADSQ